MSGFALQEACKCRRNRILIHDKRVTFLRELFTNPDFAKHTYKIFTGSAPIVVWRLALDSGLNVTPFRKRDPYPVDGGKILHNRVRLALLHLSEERIARLIDSVRAWPDCAQSIVWLLKSDALKRRRHYQALRSRDDERFCRRFRCPV